MDAVLKLLPNDVPGAKLKHEIVDKNSVDIVCDDGWLQEN